MDRRCVRRRPAWGSPWWASAMRGIRLRRVKAVVDVSAQPALVFGHVGWGVPRPVPGLARAVVGPEHGPHARVDA